MHAKRAATHAICSSIMASKRSRTVGTTSNTIVHVGAIDQETYGRGYSNDDEDSGDNILIDVGGSMQLELGMNHWDQQQWLNVGFKGERAAWADGLRPSRAA